MRERQSERTRRRGQRTLARESARNRVLEAVSSAVADESPDWFNAEQDACYKQEMDRLWRRLSSHSSTVFDPYCR